ncbi:hypothetical protein [Tuwongella immobilis]|uniref:hypothetical protein n=1 Tax=Tuwongella immobilis TaxID=692036 RepID=UPI0013A6FD7B|nr:hypothetical protein [Tuwongella immobilis]
MVELGPEPLPLADPLPAPPLSSVTAEPPPFDPDSLPLELPDPLPAPPLSGVTVDPLPDPVPLDELPLPP